MQRRRWLDRRLRKHFHQRNPPAVAVPEGVADPEGVSDVVPEEEEGVQVYYRSELVVPSDVRKVLRHYLPVDVQREASERQEERLQ